jgi:PAS domain S-box-containing protein
MLRLFPHHVMF